jgi:hypothetical protein
MAMTREAGAGVTAGGDGTAEFSAQDASAARPWSGMASKRSGSVWPSSGASMMTPWASGVLLDAQATDDELAGKGSLAAHALRRLLWALVSDAVIGDRWA